jgi:hypothetical protein
LLKVGVSNGAISLQYIHSKAALSVEQFTYWWCRPDKIGMATMTPHRPTPGRILAQRQVRARLIVIRRIRSKNLPQVRLTKDQQSVQALAAHGVDQAFRISHFASFFAQAKTGLGTSIVKAPAHNSKT